MAKRKRHWYDRRKREDAPAEQLEDMGHDKISAWCLGYNDAVKAFAQEYEAVLKTELGDWLE